jgi:hypothetical protein
MTTGSKKKKARGPRRCSGGKPAPAPAEESTLKASIPAIETPRETVEAHFSFFITNAQKALLRAKGYSDEEIAKMKPADAHRILGLK